MADAATDKKLSKVEHIKLESNGLRGTIKESLQSDAMIFDEPDFQLLKHHGSYQQDNRDVRAERRRAKLDKDWIYMVRTKMPGGRMTADQYLAEDELARKFSYGSLRITSRQGIQFHGVGRENLKPLIKGINDVRLSTLGACGDVNRNTMACPVSDLDWRSDLGMEQLAAQIAEHLAPSTSSYWEIWCEGLKYGQKVEPNADEPIYGKQYMPRKFKIGIAVPEDNCVDLYTQDLGIEVVHEDGRLVAYDIIVGGGMGFTMSKQETYPRLGSRLVRCAPDEIMEVVEGVVGIQRDYGDRANRAHARLKYVVEERGVEWMHAELNRRLSREFPEAGQTPVYKVEDHLGWHEANDGTLFVGVRIPNGRIQDSADGQLMTGLREIVTRFRPEVRATPQQNVVLAGLKPGDRQAVEQLARDHGIKTMEEYPTLMRRSMACPALPTCGLALAESERVMPTFIEELEKLGSANHQIEFRMTGCPNSCVRTPTAEIGVVGRGPGKYAIYVGGNEEGTRLADQLNDRVEMDQVAPMLHRLIQMWRGEVADGEKFGDWAHSKGVVELNARLENGAA